MTSLPPLIRSKQHKLAVADGVLSATMSRFRMSGDRLPSDARLILFPCDQGKPYPYSPPLQFVR